MTYTVFLLPNTCIQYPKFIIQLIESENDSAFVITLDKYIETACPNAYYLERSYGEKGEKTVSNSKIIKKIRKKQPTLVLLDNCFWESNANLINEIFILKSQMNFKLVNVMQLHDVKYCGNIARLGNADCIFAPSWKKEYIMQCNFPDNISFYNEDELYRIGDKIIQTDIGYSKIDMDSQNKYRIRYGNFSHVLNIMIDDTICENDKRNIMDKIYNLLNEKIINECSEFNEKTNLKMKWKGPNTGGNYYIGVYREK